MNGEDRDLGMGRPISRRDFVQGVAVATGAAATLASGAARAAAPAGTAVATPDPATYPPMRTGMRGAHPGSFEAAHALRDGSKFAAPEATGESYDLVVVGAGISGLAAAYFYRKRYGDGARILILDNHDDYGGHAKRNEFWHEGKQFIVNAGSSYMVAPPTWTKEAISLIDDMGVDWRNPPGRGRRGAGAGGLGPSTYFNKQAFGADRLVIGSILAPTPEFMAKTPLPPQLRAEILQLYTGKTDYLAGMSPAEKMAKLQSMSYRDYLLNVAKLSPEALHYSRGIWCLGNDMGTAWFAFFRHRPGFEGLGLQRPHSSPEGEEHEAVDFNWPAGNSEIARLLVRSMIPASLPSGPWQSVHKLQVNYATLDQSSSPVRIRLSSIVLSAKHVGPKPAPLEPEGREVEVAYVTAGRISSVRAKNVIMACMNNVIPYLCPDMPEAQKQALHLAVRAVNQQTNVLFRNWEAFAKLKTNNVVSPKSFYGGFGASTGGSPDPSQPVLGSFSTGANSGILSNMTMVSELTKGNPPAPGTSNDDQFRAVRAGLLATPFDHFERSIRQMSAGALSAGGFDPARDILAVAVNRWPHGFATGRNYLWDDPNQMSPTIPAKQKFGRIAICNSDAGAISTAQVAIDEAARAVRDLDPRDYGFYEMV